MFSYSIMLKLMYFFFKGMACQECNQLICSGITDYVKSWYNLMDVTLLILYCSSFTLRYFCMYKVSKNVQVLFRSLVHSRVG